MPPHDRREFLATLGSMIAMGTPLAAHASVTRAPRVRAVAFDGYAIFDPTPVVSVAESIVPGRGRELVTAWRTRQFEYQWLRTLGNHYADFRHTAEEGLTFAARSLEIALTAETRARLLDAHLTLVPWPDALDSARKLHAAGVRLAFLSNMTASMLDDGARRAGFRDVFEHVLSTDKVGAAKPDGRAYGMALDAFGLQRNEIVFVAFAGWDAAGASWFGYPTVWTNRLSSPSEELDAAPTLVARDLGDVVRFVMRYG